MNRKRLISIVALFALASVVSCANHSVRQRLVEAAEEAKIAFDPAWDGNMEIYLMSPDGSDQRRLTHTPGGKDSWLPAWSPDRRRISFSSNRDGQSQLYVMNSDGTNLSRLTNAAGVEYSNTAWSPDGKRIAFDPNRDGRQELYVMDADGSNVRQLTHFVEKHQGAGNPDWSPDGTRIVFEVWAESDVNDSRIEIYVMNSDGSNLRQLTRMPDRGSLLPDRGSWTPRWSPDGKNIVFASNRDGASSKAVPDIYLMAADGSRIRRLTAGGEHVWSARPFWSPDGKSIVFPSNRDCPPFNGTFNRKCGDIYVMRADGSHVRRLTQKNEGNGHPAW